MNNQFATQFLLQEDEFDSLRNALYDLGASDDSVQMLVAAVTKGYLKPSQAVDIAKNTVMREDGGAVGGGSTTGGGVTNGATFTPGAGEQYAAGTRKKKYQENARSSMHRVGDKVTYLGYPAVITRVEKDIQGRINYSVSYNKGNGATKVSNIISTDDSIKAIAEDAPQLAGEKSKTNKQGAKNLSAYSSVGFTKAPSALEAGKKIKGVQVKDLWDEEPLSESRAYNQFKKEAATRNKPDQLHQAAKVIQNKLEEVSRLLEFTAQMRTELSEGDINLEYKHNTKKVFEKINSKVIEVYTKVKSLK